MSDDLRMGTGVMHISLPKLAKAMGERPVTFCETEDGLPMHNDEAREALAAYLRFGYDRIPLRKETAPAFQFETETTKKLARLKKRREELEQEKRQWILTHHTLVLPMKLVHAIANCESQIKEAEEYAPKKLSEILPKETVERSGLEKLMLKTHVACDYLTEVMSSIKDIFEDCGLHDSNLTRILDGILRQSNAFASSICHPEFLDLANLVADNERLIKDIDTLVDLHFKNKGYKS